MHVAIMIVGTILIVAGLTLWALPLLGKVIPAVERLDLSKVPFVGEVKVPTTFALIVIGAALFIYPTTPLYPDSLRPPAAGGGGSSNPAESPRPLDCRGASQPPFESELRVTIIDGLREHYGYSGEYVVEQITKVGDWAYVVGSQYEGKGSGVERAFVLQSTGVRWEWRWEGDPTTRPADPGLPSGFQPVARTAMVCES
jgi:hypothetical protein